MDCRLLFTEVYIVEAAGLENVFSGHASPSSASLVPSAAMKLLGVTLASLGLASAATVAKKVSYDDWKVFRVNVGSDAAKLQDVMTKLQLELWKGKPESSDVVDLMVPPSAVKDFEASTQSFETKLMHDNLGASIANEHSFSVYAGIFPLIVSRHGLCR